jgi:hypothetical protein
MSDAFEKAAYTAASALLVGLVLFYLKRWHDTRDRKSAALATWERVVKCAKCSRRIPTWFLFRPGELPPMSERKPLESYNVPTRCRICRHNQSLPPIPWQEPESEEQYNARTVEHERNIEDMARQLWGAADKKDGSYPEG